MTLESRIILVTLGVGLLFLINIPTIKSRLKVIPGINSFVYFLYFLVAAWAMDLSAYFSENRSIPVIEHLLYMGSSLLLIIWIIKITRSRES